MAYPQALNTIELSPLAQNLLREIENEANGAQVETATLAPPTETSAPIIEAPIADGETTSFINMLSNLDEVVLDTPVLDDGLDSDDAASDVIFSDTQMEEIAPEDAPPIMEKGAFDAIADPPAKNKKSGFHLRFWARTKNAEVARRVGFKDASAAYHAQSNASLLPFTILRIGILVFVAIMPPLLNFLLIQPQIANNNRKLTEIRKFEVKSEEDQRVASNVAEKVIRAQKTGLALVQGVLPTSNFEVLFNGYVGALQRYGMVLNSYNVSADPEQSVIFGDKNMGNKKLQANIVQMELEGRYDVYTEIRRVFVQESKNVKLLAERFEPLDKSLNLRITSKILVPTLGSAAP